ncbi:phenylalanine tRS [Acrasis kona]|uniref:Phenylalanine tRS n=1 Tax=Acrasis kona TaxID=1008807 RepID=A0AAW2Z0B5_9EUKA
MNIREQFRDTRAIMSSFMPVISDIYRSNELWSSIKVQNNVQVTGLPSSIYKSFPSLVRGTTIMNMSLTDMFHYNHNQTLAQMKMLNPILVDYKKLYVQPGKNTPTLYKAFFQPPVWLVARRDYIFLNETFLYDRQGNEIDIPDNVREDLDRFVLANSHRIQKIVALTRSVTEDEINKSSLKNELQSNGSDVRGFIRCIAWIGDKVDENTCEVSILTDMDIGGTIPEKVKQIISQYNADGLITLKKHLDQRKGSKLPPPGAVGMPQHL